MNALLVLTALLAPAQNAPLVPSPDLFAGDPYRDDVGYRAAVDRALGLLQAESVRDSGKLAVRDLLEKHPDSPILRYERGCHLAEDQKWERAVKEWETAAKADAGRSIVTARSLEGVTEAFTRLGKKDDALKTAERLAAAAPLSYRLQNRLADALKAKGDADKARASWLRSFQLNPAQDDLAKKLGLPDPSRRTDKAPELTALLKKIRPSVVLLKDGDSRFTGFAALGPGWIVTCDHGLLKKSTSVEVVYFTDEKNTSSFKGDVVLRDPDRDLAVIRCPDLPKTASAFPLASVEGLEAGTRVYTLGHPGLGGDMLTLTPSEGILAKSNRELEGTVFIQCNMAVNPGNSGGPLFNAYGEVIGVVVRKADLEGVSFAVSSIELAELLADPGPLHPPVGTK